MHLSHSFLLSFSQYEEIRLSFFEVYLLLLYVCGCFVHLSAHHLSARCLWRLEEGIRSLGLELQTVMNLHMGALNC